VTSTGQTRIVVESAEMPARIHAVRHRFVRLFVDGILIAQGGYRAGTGG
jgi:hypothetical protein